MAAKISWFKVAMVMLPAVRSGIAKMEESIKADSDGGQKITLVEATDIAAAILSEIHEPLVQIIMESNK